MKTQNIHTGSFLIGLLGLIMSQPLHTETQTSQRLRNESHQFQVSTSRGFDKAWLQFRSELAVNWQKTAADIRQSFSTEAASIGSGLRSSSMQPCTWFAWLDRQFAHFAALVNIHSGLLNAPVCRS